MINRRNFILASLGLTTSPYSLFAKNTIKNAHIVIVGAGWGGLSFAKTLRYLDKDCKITIIDKQNSFISCPISNWVIGQIKNMQDITFSTTNFIENNKINYIKKEVSFIDFSNKKVHFNKENISYDKLVLSPGVEMDYDSIIGLKKAYDGNNVLSAWKAGKETISFSNRVRELRDGENIVISIPLSPYRCPPGPYERASLLADYIKTKNLKCKVIVLDANQKIISKGSLFKKAWDDFYDNIIEYHSDKKVLEIDNKEKKILTDFDEYKYDIANIIPAQRAPYLLKNSGLVEVQKLILMIFHPQ